MKNLRLLVISASLLIGINFKVYPSTAEKNLIGNMIAENNGSHTPTSYLEIANGQRFKIKFLLGVNPFHYFGQKVMVAGTLEGKELIITSINRVYQGKLVAITRGKNNLKTPMPFLELPNSKYYKVIFPVGLNPYHFYGHDVIVSGSVFENEFKLVSISIECLEIFKN